MTYSSGYPKKYDRQSLEILDSNQMGESVHFFGEKHAMETNRTKTVAMNRNWIVVDPSFPDNGFLPEPNANDERLTTGI